jgi:hypothetical protein
MNSARKAGYMMSPLPGLRNFRFHPNAFCNELLTHDTSDRAEISG